MNKRLNGLVIVGVVSVLLSIGWFLIAAHLATSADPEEQAAAVPVGSFGIALVTVGAVLISCRNSISRCPECKSLQTTALKRKEVGVGSWFIDDRQCRPCGADWTPAMPRRVAFLLVVFGAGMAIGLGWATIAGIRSISEKRGDGILIWPFGAVIGIIIFAYGFRVLTGKSGKVRINKNGNLNGT